VNGNRQSWTGLRRPPLRDWAGLRDGAENDRKSMFFSFPQLR
jgi:hypothetical protein